MKVKERKHGHNTDRYFGTHSRRRTTHLASQQELGILSQWWTWIDRFDFDYSAAVGADLK